MKTRSLILLLAVWLSGCGIFRKVDKEKTAVEHKTAVEASSEAKETDQGTVHIWERWGFNPPASVPAAPANPDASAPKENLGDILDLKDALTNTRSENQNLKQAMEKLQGFWYEKLSSEKKDLKKEGKETFQATDDKKEEVAKVTKEPGANWTLIIIACFALLLIVTAGVVIYFFNKIKKDIQLIKTAARIL
jgi:hypothetical protein